MRRRLPVFCLLSLLGLTFLATGGGAVAEPDPEPTPEPMETVVDLDRDWTAGEHHHEGWIDFNKNGRQEAYENPRAPLETRVEDLLSRMTVEEKTCQLATLYGFGAVLEDELPTPAWHERAWKDGIANIDQHLDGKWGSSDLFYPPSRHAWALNTIQRWFVDETRLGIPVDFTCEGVHGLSLRKATNFPYQLAMGSTWNRELVCRQGEIVGLETKAVGFTNLYAPILDIIRDPRWGRTTPCYGEDPYLLGELGVAFTKGVRSNGIAATAKHFFANSIVKGGRDYFSRTDSQATPREIATIHLVPFERAVREGDLLGVMCAYNDYDGIPIGASKHFLLDVLRGEWGFRGYVVSDSGVVEQMRPKYRLVPDYKHATAMWVKSGGNVRTTFQTPESFLDPLRRAIAEGLLSMDDVDQRVREVLRTKFLIGLFDHPYVVDPRAADRVVGASEHRAVALEAARQSVILLKNEGDVLPLRRDLGRVLVAGPGATYVGHSEGNYGPTKTDIVSVLEGIQALVGDEVELVHAQGCAFEDARFPLSDILYEPPGAEEQAGIDGAVAAAADVDAIVAVIGDSLDQVGESRSRINLDPSGYQRDLVKALHATGKPVVVVVLSGRPLTINWIAKHVPGVVQCWFAGEFTGQAIAEVLFGDVEPSGRLPVSVPRFVGQVPFNFPYKHKSQGEQGRSDHPEGIGKTRVYGALYPFGFGLGYTTFEYTNLEITPAKATKDTPISVRFRVHNTGARPGVAVPQLYVRDLLNSVTTFHRNLCGFERVELVSGETKEIALVIQPTERLWLIDPEGERVVEPGAFGVWVGASSADLRLEGSFEIVDPGKEGRIVATVDDDVTRHAARELKRTVEQATGATFPIVADGEAGRDGVLEIRVGWSAEAKVAAGEDLPPDAFLWKSLGEDRLLIGGPGQGTLYGVYAFLEEHIGVRRYTPEVTHVPKLERVELPPLDEVRRPAFPVRWLHMPCAEDQAYCDWHGIHSRAHREASWGMFVHTFHRLVSPEEHFEEHPEYFSEIQGRRLANQQLCLTNEDVFDLVVAGLKERMERRPDSPLWSVSQNDWHGACECADCRALVEKHGGEAGPLLTFVNRVAAEFPDQTISTLAYTYTRKAPTGIVPAPNVNICLCSIECDRAEPLATGVRNADFLRDVREWSALTDNLMLWDYVVQFSNYVSPFPNFRVLQPNIRFFRDARVQLMFQQGSGGSKSDLSELKQYLIAKLLWNPDADVDALTDDFLAGYYGAASGHLRRYIQLMHSRLQEVGDELSIYGSPTVEGETWLTPETLLAADRILEAAEAVVADRPEIRARVREVRLSIAYARLEQGRRYGTGEYGLFEAAPEGGFRVKAMWPPLLDAFVEGCERGGFRNVHERKSPPAVYAKEMRRFFEEGMVTHLALGLPVSLSVPHSPKYPASGVPTLTDGVRGTTDYRCNWLGWEAVDAAITLDLGEAKEVRRLSADFLQVVASWIWLPTEVRWLVSEDGETWEPVAVLKPQAPAMQKEPFMERFACAFEARPVRYVRLEATSVKHCPPWHHGAGGDAWIFLDEVVISDE